MKNTDKHESLELEQYLDDGDILYSPKDKQYFRLALDAVINHSMGLAVIGSNETALTHYSRILTSRLRKERTFQLDNFPPTNTEELLRKFNQLLSQMTMDQARQKPAADKPITLMLVNDANVVDPVQWTLLLQLLSDFPGINVRMVLFFNKATWPAYDETLKLLGRNLFRWDIEIPSTLEAKEFFSAARGTIYERETALFLNDVGLEGVVKEVRIQTQADQVLLGGQQNYHITENQDDSPREPFVFKDKDEGIKQHSGKQPGLLKGLMVVGILGAVAFGLFPNQVGEYKVVPTGVTGELQSEKVPSEIFIPPPFLAAETVEEIEPDQHSVIPEDNYRADTSNPDPQSEGIVLEDQKTIANTLPIPLNIKAEGESADNKSQQNGLQQLKILPKTTFFVQHIVLKSDQSIVDYIIQFPTLSDARILPINSQGNKSFGIISGPFSSRDEANKFATGPGIPEEFWLWGAEQLEAWCQRNQTCDF